MRPAETVYNHLQRKCDRLLVVRPDNISTRYCKHIEQKITFFFVLDFQCLT